MESPDARGNAKSLFYHQGSSTNLRFDLDISGEAAKEIVAMMMDTEEKRFAMERKRIAAEHERIAAKLNMLLGGTLVLVAVGMAAVAYRGESRAPARLPGC